MKRETILVVDDEPKIGKILCSLLKEEGYQAYYVQDGAKALKVIFQTTPSVVLLDLKMPGMDGFEVLARLKERGFTGKIIIMTAFGSIPSAVKAIKKGAFDYIAKPFDNDLLLHTIKRASMHHTLEVELEKKTEEVNGRYSLSGIITANSDMRELFRLVDRAAPTDVPILITGESGTGKELFARAIHSVSNRSAEPFVPLNCGALPHSLVESELFGYKKGAFSGATTDKQGLVEIAENGTLFLDEIGELSISSQVKLLRFLEDSSFVRLGDTRQHSVSVRIVAATNRDLTADIKNNSFRQDLYFRLNVITLHIPPLRERVEDIPLLVKHFLEKHGENLGRLNANVDEDALRFLMQQSWAGNVRELENTIKRTLLLATDDKLGVEAFQNQVQSESTLSPDNRPTNLSEMVDEQKMQLEREEIKRQLAAHGGNRTHTAEALGISRNTLLRRLKKYGLS